MLKAAIDDPAQITVRKLQTVDNDYVNLLKELKDNQQYRFIIDCKVDKVRKILYAVSASSALLLTRSNISDD